MELYLYCPHINLPLAGTDIPRIIRIIRIKEKWRKGIISYLFYTEWLCNSAIFGTPSLSLSLIHPKNLNLKHFEQYLFQTFTNPILFCFTYEGWNFNSGNYLFTTDTK